MLSLKASAQFRSRCHKGDNAPSQEFFQRSIDLDSTFAGGYRGLALARFEAAETFQRLDLNEAQTSAEKAHTCLGYALLARGEHQSSVAEIKRALSMSPNLAFAHGQLGAALLFSSPSDEAMAHLRTSIRLDPRDPLLAMRLTHLAVGHYFCHEYGAAVEVAKRVILSYPDPTLLPLACRRSGPSQSDRGGAPLRSSIDSGPSSRQAPLSAMGRPQKSATPHSCFT